MPAERRSFIESAFIWTGFGEKDRAFESLEAALERREGDIPFLDVEPLFDVLRTDPRFPSLLRRAGLR
ncbi:MAG: hypothetical protein HYX76_12470 [Acidobacteria bacterium]|nr:hypothetical protein [Acidobacteriota bacterium]